MKKNILRIIIVVPLLLIFMVLCSDYLIHSTTRVYCYDTLENLPENNVGVVLGTAKYVPGGHANQYYQYRVEAVCKLFDSGKIKYVLISGDNIDKTYNEPVAIKKDLIKQKIPEDRIYLDYAGIRTFDSIIRASKVFGLTQFTVISQQFQNERAVFIGRRAGLEVVGYNAQDVGDSNISKIMLREKLARIKMLLDIYVFHQEPEFLGDAIKIP